jgi:NADPH:quinone reductase-like Zn-dependent oxidoreductase
MKAILYRKYGSPDVLHLEEVETPIAKDNEILVRVFATAVNSGDVRLRKADPFAVRFMFGLLHPNKNILGNVFAGEIESIGKDVKKFKEGDQVYGTTGMSMGAYAEYKCLSENGMVALKPENVIYKEAAAIPFGAIAALHFLRKANIKKGQEVLIYGASGAVGVAAVQIAKYFGAEVTGVCSTSNIEMVRSLGAHSVIDYTKEAFNLKMKNYDVIFDTVGKSPFSKSVKALKKNGIYLRAVHMALSSVIQGLWVSLTSKKKVMGGITMERVEDLNFLNTLVANGELKPVIDRSYCLEDIAEAHTYVERGHKKGNVVVTIK